jgi:hypothetical protein
MKYIWLMLALVMSDANRSARALTFQFNPDPGTPQAVIDAFGLAAMRWSQVLQNDIVVNLDIGFAPMSGGVLGQTDYSFIHREYAAVRSALSAAADSADDLSAVANLQTGVSYGRLINRTTDNPAGANSAQTYVHMMNLVSLTRANAKALMLLDENGAPDGAIRFNSGVAFDFDPSDGTTSGHFDFVTIATHEIGHALGFASIINQLEQIPSNAGALPSTVLDLLRFSAQSLGAGPGYIDSSADGRAKYFSLNGGLQSVALFATGAVYGSGYQADHWQEWSFAGLMDPQSFPGLQRRLSTTDLRAFDAIGYQVPEPALGLILLPAVCWAMRGRRR